MNSSNAFTERVEALEGALPQLFRPMYAGANIGHPFGYAVGQRPIPAPQFLQHHSISQAELSLSEL
jgi:hypothetical protein